MIQKWMAFFFSTTIGITLVFAVVSVIILLISMVVFDYFHDMTKFKVYVNTNGHYLPYVSTAIGKVCDKYNAIVVGTQIIKEPNTNPYLKYM